MGKTREALPPGARPSQSSGARGSLPNRGFGHPGFNTGVTEVGFVRQGLKRTGINETTSTGRSAARVFSSFVAGQEYWP